MANLIQITFSPFQCDRNIRRSAETTRCVFLDFRNVKISHQLIDCICFVFFFFVAGGERQSKGSLAVESGAGFDNPCFEANPNNLGTSHSFPFFFFLSFVAYIIEPDFPALRVSIFQTTKRRAKVLCVYLISLFHAPCLTKSNRHLPERFGRVAFYFYFFTSGILHIMKKKKRRERREKSSS